MLKNLNLCNLISTCNGSVLIKSNDTDVATKVRTVRLIIQLKPCVIFDLDVTMEEIKEHLSAGALLQSNV